MTTTQPMFGESLIAQSEEDTMEIGTSPYANLDDIDLDLDDNRDHSLADNSMIDDTTDNMDSVQAENNSINHDDIMYDEAVDEELLDFGDDLDLQPHHPPDTHHDFDNYLGDDLHLHPGHPTHSKDITGSFQEHAEPLPQSAEEPDLVDDEDEDDLTNPEESPQGLGLDPDLQPEDITPAAAIPQVHHETATDVIDYAPELSEPNQHTTDLAPSANLHQDTVSESIDALNVGTETTKPSHQLVDHEQVADESAFSLEEAEDEETDIAQARLTPDGSSTPPACHVTVEYAGQYFPLFPTHTFVDETEPILNDLSLAQKPVENLLHACRAKFADHLGHFDEAVLDIPSLGLHICEDSKYAAQLTLAHVYDTYMLLSQNQVLTSINPLSCHLTFRACLESQMNYLQTSASEGRTYADIEAEHHDLAEVGVSDLNDEDEYANDTEYYDTANDQEEVQEDEESTEHDNSADLTAVESVKDDPSPAETGDPTEAIPPEMEESKLNIPTEVDPELVDPHQSLTQTHEDFDEHLDNSLYSSAGVHGGEVGEVGGEVGPDDFDQESLTSEPDDLYDGTTHEHASEEPNELLADESEAYEDRSLEDTEYQNHEQPDSVIAPVQDGLDFEDDVIDFDDLAEEYEVEIHVTNNPDPVTPSKNVNGKRKFVEQVDDDDYIDFDLDTPDAKRTRSS